MFRCSSELCRTRHVLHYHTNNTNCPYFTIKINGTVAANYDRGWDIEPTCKEAELALCILLNNYN